MGVVSYHLERYPLLLLLLLLFPTVDNNTIVVAAIVVVIITIVVIVIIIIRHYCHRIPIPFPIPPPSLLFSTIIILPFPLSFFLFLFMHGIISIPIETLAWIPYLQRNYSILLMLLVRILLSSSFHLCYRKIYISYCSFVVAAFLGTPVHGPQPLERPKCFQVVIKNAGLPAPVPTFWWNVVVTVDQ